MPHHHEREPVEFSIPGQLISSKNSRKPVLLTNKTTGKTRIIPAKSKAAEKNEDYLLGLMRTNHQFRHTWMKELARVAIIGGWPIVLHFRIYRKDKSRFDFNNITQNLLDCLVKSELLPDDDADHVIPRYEPHFIDKENPRTIIRIEPYSRFHTKDGE